METNKIRQIISNNLGVEVSDIEPEAHFILDLNASPKELMDIKTQLEAEFDIIIPVQSEDDFPETVEELELLVHDLCL